MFQGLWDWLFFWQKVPDQIPLEPKRFRLLNPHVIRETALHLLKFPTPTKSLWGWNQVIDTSQSSDYRKPRYTVKLLQCKLGQIQPVISLTLHLKVALVVPTCICLILGSYQNPSVWLRTWKCQLVASHVAMGCEIKQKLNQLCHTGAPVCLVWDIASYMYRNF